MSSNHNSSQHKAATTIQRRYRGVIGRKKTRNLRIFRHRVIIQKRLETSQGQLYFRIERHGAAIIIQNWFKNCLHRCRKRLWWRKYKRFIDWRKRFFILRRALKKTKGYNLIMSQLLEDKAALRNATAIILCRISRGYLDRKRMNQYHDQRIAYDLRRHRASIVLQALSRMYICRLKYPHVGQRFFMLRKKKQRWNLERLKPLKLSDELTNSLQAASNSVDEDFSFVLLRRQSFYFRNIHLGDLNTLDRLDSLVTRIQNLFRRMKAKKRFRLLVMNRNIVLILRIQHWLIAWHWRRTVRKSLCFIQPFWKFKAGKYIRRRNAIAKMQRFWRSSLGRYHFKAFLVIKHAARKTILSWVRTVKQARKERRQVLIQRSLLERSEAGALLYSLTRLRWHAFFLLQGARKVKTHVANHELQKLFSALSLNGMMDSGKLIKYFKENKVKLLSSDFTVNTIELQFAKVRDPTEKRIDYKQFIDLLTNLGALKILQIDASNPNSDENASDNKEPNAKITKYSFANLTGSSAILMKFVFTYIIASTEYGRLVTTLGDKAAVNVSSVHIDVGIRGMQRFFRNKLCIKKLTKDLQELLRQKRLRKESAAATILQNLVRRFLGRRLVVRLAQEVYSKYIDGESDRPYWYNSRTERAFWTKPSLLGRFDCGMATRMPLAEEEFKVLCNICEKVSATCYCLDCKEPYCTPCYANGHRSGNRLQHRHLIMENCVQCEYQIGTRSCKNCGDVFCDSCYRYIHKKGRLRFHLCNRLCPKCENCDEYSAQWVEVVSMTSSRLWCNVCFKSTFGCMAHEFDDGNMILKRVDYYGQSFRTFKLKNDEELRKKAISDAFAKRLQELERMKRVRAAIDIQRVLRGYWKRKSLRDFLAERREFMRIRRQEEGLRNSIYYKLLYILGFSIPLQSDTTLERVMKVYPWFKHHILAAAIENNWTMACRLLVEHEERLAANPKATLYQKAAALLQYYLAKKKFDSADADYVEKCRLFDIAETNYQEGKKKKFSPIIVSKLNDLYKRAEEAKRKAHDERAKSEAAKVAAEDAVFNTVGPRGIQTLVNDKKKHGVSLPYVVTIRKYSRLALVSLSKSDSSAYGDIESGKVGDDDDDDSEKNTDTINWREKVAIGDYLIIQGAQFKVVPTVMRKKKAKKVRRDDDSDSDVSASPSRSRRNNSSNGKAASDTAPEPPNTSQSGRHLSAKSDGPANSAKELQNVVLLKREDPTENHIQLDRMWMVDDAVNVAIAKALPLTFYMIPLRFLEKLLLCSYPAQKVVAISAIVCHKTGSLLRLVATLFDDESGAKASLTAYTKVLDNFRDGWLHMSRSPVNMSFDFAARRWLFALIGWLLSRLLKLFKLLVSLSKLLRTKRETPYDFWQKSITKSEIHCVLDMGGEEFKPVGEIRMDMEAPLDIMREYLERNFRDALNEIVGSSFVFIVVRSDTGKIEILPREDEFKTPLKNYTSEQTNARTMVTSKVITIVRDKDREKELIPEREEEEDSDDDDESGAKKKKNNDDDDGEEGDYN